MIKRILGLLLSCLFLVSCFPLVSSAESSENHIITQMYDESDGEKLDVNAPQPYSASTPQEYNIEFGNSMTVSSQHVTFKCEDTYIGTDVIVYSSTPSNVRIYKDKWFSDDLLYAWGNSTYVKKTISDCAINSGSNTFIVEISCESTSTITCSIIPHVDSAYNTQGGVWRISNTSARTNNVDPCTVYYFTKDQISLVVDMVSKNNYLDVCQQFCEGTISATAAVASLYSGKLLSMAATVFLVDVFEGFNFFADIFNFKQQLLDEINDAAGYVGDDANGFPIYTRGVRFEEWMSVGTGTLLYGYEVEQWPNPSTGHNAGWVKGPIGYTGSIELTNFDYYNDVTPETQYYDEIIALTNRNFIEGIDDNVFAPNNNMRRCDFALMLYRAAGSRVPGGLDNTVLLDVESNSYYYDAIVWAVNRGIINGTDSYITNGVHYIQFEPQSYIRKCDALLMLYRFADLLDKDTSTVSTLSFSDSQDIPDYAVTAVKWAVKQNIVANTGSLSPMQYISRSSCVKWFYTFCEHYGV